MKIKLTPELSYIIGLWKERRTKEGIGVYGGEELLSLFAKVILEGGLSESNKLLTGGEEEGTGSLYFYNTSYRKFFQKVIGEELERYKYRNEYSASFLAGLFDAVGGITAEGKVYLSRCTQKDEMVLYRIGFNPIRRNGALYFSRPMKFLLYVKPFSKRFADHPVLSGMKGNVPGKPAKAGKKGG